MIGDNTSTLAPMGTHQVTTGPRQPGSCPPPPKPPPPKFKAVGTLAIAASRPTNNATVSAASYSSSCLVIQETGRYPPFPRTQSLVLATEICISRSATKTEHHAPVILLWDVPKGIHRALPERFGRNILHNPRNVAAGWHGDVCTVRGGGVLYGYFSAGANSAREIVRTCPKKIKGKIPHLLNLECIGSKGILGLQSRKGTQYNKAASNNSADV